MAIDTLTETPVNQPLAVLNQLNQILALKDGWAASEEAKEPFYSGFDPYALQNTLQFMIDSPHAYPGSRMSKNWRIEGNTYISTVLYENTANLAQSIEIKYERDARYASHSLQVLYTGGNQPLQGFRIAYFPEFGEYRIATNINNDIKGYTFNNKGEVVYDIVGDKTLEQPREETLTHERFHLEQFAVEYAFDAEWRSFAFESANEAARKRLKELEESEGDTYTEMLADIHRKKDEQKAKEEAIT